MTTQNIVSSKKTLITFFGMVVLWVLLVVLGNIFFSSKGVPVLKNKILSGSIEPKNVSEYLDGIDAAANTTGHDDVLGKELAPVIADYRAWDYDGAIAKQEVIVQQQESSGGIISESKDVQKARQIGNKLFLANLYLQKGNYEYKEKEYADKAIKTITDMTEDDYGAHGMYFVGYAYEITKQYDKALEWYEKGLRVSSNSDILKATFKNQIGHVYDLRWDPVKAYGYYTEAYNLDKTNYVAATNIGRYLARTGKLDESMKFFEYALGTPSTRLRAELYFSMSSIVLNINGLKPDIDKSIEYAKKGIELAPTYPMGYVALARGLYMKNDANNYEEIKQNLEKALKLYPDNYYAYEFLALNEYDQGNLKISIDLLDKALYAIKNDKNLMDDERKGRDNRINYEKFLFMIVKMSYDTKKPFAEKLYNYALIPDGKDLIRVQLKRNNYGYLQGIKDEKWFDMLLKLYK